MTEDNRIPEIRAVLDEADRDCRIPGGLPIDEMPAPAVYFDRIRAIVDRELPAVDPRPVDWPAVAEAFADETSELNSPRPPVPRVFFPGDTVPADTGVMDETGGGGRRFGWDWEADYVYVECWIPTREEWQAAVDRAQAGGVQPHPFRDDGLGNLSRVPGTETCMHCGLKKRAEVHHATADRARAERETAP